MKPEVYSCLKMLRALKDSCDDAYEVYAKKDTISAQGFVRQYRHIVQMLNQYLGDAAAFIPTVARGDDDLGTLLEVSSAAGMVIAYLESLEGSIQEELRERGLELARKEKELESLRKILDKSLEAVKELPEVLRSRAVAEWKRSHRDIEEASKRDEVDDQAAKVG